MFSHLHGWWPQMIAFIVSIVQLFVVYSKFMVRLLPMAYELITLSTFEPISQQVHRAMVHISINWDKFHRIFRLKFSALVIDSHYDESKFTFCFSIVFGKYLLSHFTFHNAQCTFYYYSWNSFHFEQNECFALY